MSIIQLVLVAIRGLSVITNNPALGGGSSVRLDQASELLSLLGELLERGKEGHAELKEFTEVVEAMAKEGREPTPTEWQTLRDRSDAAHATIQESAASAKAEDEAAEVEKQRLKEEALKTDIARLSDEDLQFSVDKFGIVLTEGMERAEIEALVLKAKLEE